MRFIFSAVTIGVLFILIKFWKTKFKRHVYKPRLEVDRGGYLVLVDIL